MTLLVTEIHPLDGLAKSMVVFAADRRISLGAKHHSTRKKIFPVPYLRAGVGFFGLATVGIHRVPMSDWLTQFVKRNTDAQSLQEFANALSGELNAAIPSKDRQHRSGFHIAGYGRGAAHTLPEFWYVRNIEDDSVAPKGRYEAREDFLSRDARTLGYDGQDPRSVKGRNGRVYRNGDIRAHVLAWERLDDSFGELLLQPEFRKLRKPEDYVDWVRFKMKVISYFYKCYCRVSLIAPPIDAFAITSWA